MAHHIIRVSQNRQTINLNNALTSTLTQNRKMRDEQKKRDEKGTKKQMPEVTCIENAEVPISWGPS